MPCEAVHNGKKVESEKQPLVQDKSRVELTARETTLDSKALATIPGNPGHVYPIDNTVTYPVDSLFGFSCQDRMDIRKTIMEMNAETASYKTRILFAAMLMYLDVFETGHISDATRAKMEEFDWARMDQHVGSFSGAGFKASAILVGASGVAMFLSGVGSANGFTNFVVNGQLRITTDMVGKLAQLGAQSGEIPKNFTEKEKTLYQALQAHAQSIVRQQQEDGQVSRREIEKFLNLLKEFIQTELQGFQSLAR